MVTSATVEYLERAKCYVFSTQKLGWNAGFIEQGGYSSERVESPLQGYMVAEDGSLYLSIGEQDEREASADLAMTCFEGTQARMVRCLKTPASLQQKLMENNSREDLEAI